MLSTDPFTVGKAGYALLQTATKEKLSDAIRAPTRSASTQPASRVKIDGALEAIGAMLNVVSLHYQKSETVFDGVGNPDDATQPLFVLRDGIRARREAIQRMSEGRPTDSDLDPGSPI